MATTYANLLTQIRRHRFSSVVVDISLYTLTFGYYFTASNWFFFSLLGSTIGLGIYYKATKEITTLLPTLLTPVQNSNFYSATGSSSVSVSEEINNNAEIISIRHSAKNWYLADLAKVAVNVFLLLSFKRDPIVFLIAPIVLGLYSLRIEGRTMMSAHAQLTPKQQLLQRISELNDVGALYSLAVDTSIYILILGITFTTMPTANLVALGTFAFCDLLIRIKNAISSSQLKERFNTSVVGSNSGASASVENISPEESELLTMRTSAARMNYAYAIKFILSSIPLAFVTRNPVVYLSFFVMLHDALNAVAASKNFWFANNALSLENQMNSSRCVPPTAICSH